jgi:glycosyltransferase involved in cell wall biosynthesis
MVTEPAAYAHALAGTRVVVLAGHFSPEIGYQEVDLAKALTCLGADVRVVTSTGVSRNARAVVRGPYAAGLSDLDGYSVLRLRPKLTIGSNVLGCKVLPAVKDFKPTHVVLVGPGKLFGLDVFASDSAPWSRIAIVQDNSDDGRFEGSAMKRGARSLAHRVVKRRAYRRVVRNADRVVLNVPETRDIVSEWLTQGERAKLAEKALELRLGYDPREFFFDLRARRKWRAQYSVADEEVLLVTCTRAIPSKRLEDVISSVSRLRASGLSLRYVLAGVQDDSYGEMLRRQATAASDPTGFVLLPMIRHAEMRELFSACDIGFWPRAAITIQQAMGTGLLVVLRNRPSVSHLVVPGRNGSYVEPGESLDEALTRAIAEFAGIRAEDRTASRQACAGFNRGYLSYDGLAVKILHGLP